MCRERNRALSSPGAGLLTVPRVQAKHGKAALSFYAPHIWSKLPEPTFKSGLKTFLFATAFYLKLCLQWLIYSEPSYYSSL